jgi:hypothetical protein
MDKIISMKNMIVFFAILSTNTLVAQAQIKLVSLASGFSEPTTITHANDHRLFIVEKAGRIAIVDTMGNVNQDYFLEIKFRFQCESGEISKDLHQHSQSF